MSGSLTGTLQIKWDPKNLEIRTKSVEKTLEPLVTQVSYQSFYVSFVTTLLDSISAFQIDDLFG
jgi:hypothetical protein